MKEIVNGIVRNYNKIGINVKVQVMTDDYVCFRLNGKDTEDIKFKGDTIVCDFINKCKNAIDEVIDNEK